MPTPCALRGQSQQLSLRVFAADLSAVMLFGNQTLREIKCARVVRAPLGDGQNTAGKVGLEHASRDRAVPGPLYPPRNALLLGHIVGRQRAARAYFLENPGDVVGVLFEERLETPRTHPEGFHAMPQQWPAFDRYDRRLMRPLFGELAPAVDQVVEKRLVVRPEPRIRHLVVRRHQDVDVVNLQEPELVDRAPEIARVLARPLGRRRSKPWAASATRRASLSERSDWDIRFVSKIRLSPILSHSPDFVQGEMSAHGVTG